MLLALDHAHNIGQETDIRFFATDAVLSQNKISPATPIQRPLARVLFSQTEENDSQAANSGSTTSTLLRSTAEEQARMEARESGVDWADVAMDAPGASSSAAAAAAINPFNLPPQTVSLAESAAVRSPF